MKWQWRDGCCCCLLNLENLIMFQYCSQTHLTHKVSASNWDKQGTLPWPWPGQKRYVTPRVPCGHDSITECLNRLTLSPHCIIDGTERLQTRNKFRKVAVMFTECDNINTSRNRARAQALKSNTNGRRAHSRMSETSDEKLFWHRLGSQLSLF